MEKRAHLLHVRKTRGGKGREEEKKDDERLNVRQRREEMNRFTYVRLKHSGGEEGRWRWRCREYRVSIEMKVVRKKWILEGKGATSDYFNSFI